MTWLIWGCLAADGRRDDKVAGEWEGESTGEGSKGLCYRLHLQYLLMYVGKKCCQHWARHFPGEITSLDCQWDRRSPAKSLNHSLAVISELQAVGFVIGRSLLPRLRSPDLCSIIHSAHSVADLVTHCMVRAGRTPGNRTLDDLCSWLL